MADNEIRGILVGCDDIACDFINEYDGVGGYCWVIKMKDWDTRCTECTNKIDEYKNVKNFYVYFYVFKDPVKDYEPEYDSDEFRGKIFGFADIEKVEKNKYPDCRYKHHIKIKNLRFFTN